MFDHWSILQFLDRTTGVMNEPMMDSALKLVTSPLVKNFTTQIKGWVGPVIKQQGHYPSSYPQPNT